MTTLQQVAQNVGQKEVLINQNFYSVAPAGLFSRKNPMSVGLTFQYYGGNYPNAAGVMQNIIDGSLNLTANATNYIEFNQTTVKVEFNQTGYTNGSIPIGRAVCQSIITQYFDERFIVLGATGSSGAGGGGGGGPTVVSYDNFLKLELTDPTSLATSVKISGGVDFYPYGGIYEENKTTVPAYTLNGLQSDSTYYFYLNSNYTGCTIMSSKSNLSAVPNNGINRLLYIIKTDSTKAATITDYRMFNMFINNKTFIKVMDMIDGKTTYNFDTSGILYNQDSDQLMIGAALANYPTMSLIQVTMQCKSSDQSYEYGDEAPFLTGTPQSLMTDVVATPFRLQRNRSLKVFQGDNVYVYNTNTNKYEIANNTAWRVVVKIRLDLK